MKRILITLALIVGIFMSTGWTQSRSNPQQWEYKLEYKINEKRMNELAAQGWELVGAGTDNAGMTLVGFLVFKRAR